jgi:hypothetical protein
MTARASGKSNVWLSGRTRSQFFQNAAFLGHSRYLMYWEHGKPQSGEFLIDDYNPGYDAEGPSMIRVPGPAAPATRRSSLRVSSQTRPGTREELGRLLTLTLSLHGERQSLLGPAHGIWHRRAVRRVRPRETRSTPLAAWLGCATFSS